MYESVQSAQGTLAMALLELAHKLRRAYTEAPEGEKVTMIHLFGIRHAQELQRHSIRELAHAAGLNKSYITEIGKGIRLARYVDVR